MLTPLLIWVLGTNALMPTSLQMVSYILNSVMTGVGFILYVSVSCTRHPMAEYNVMKKGILTTDPVVSIILSVMLAELPLASGLAHIVFLIQLNPPVDCNAPETPTLKFTLPQPLA
jgi:hypothetical protein